MTDDGGRRLVAAALSEDLDGRGDITSQWTVPVEAKGRGVISAREEVVVAGLPLAQEVMRQVDESVVFTSATRDGDVVRPDGELAVVEGSVRSILTAERTMLNFLMHLSGVATQSRRFARAVEGTGARVVDTRKTLPGLRVWEKRAVMSGGCGNHRFGLFDMVMVKDNHLEASGGVRAALDRVRVEQPHYVKIEVEVESEADLREAIACQADVIMLDNQDLDSLKRMVDLARELQPDVVLEASGRVTLENVGAIAETGVDVISTSALTMSAPPVDLALTLSMGAR